MIVLFYCNCCKKTKEGMDMNSIEDELCKLCWAKKYSKREKILGHPDKIKK